MKKINLQGVSEILNKKELKNVTGGSGNCSIKCTCNGVSYGNVCTMQECWGKC